MLNISYRITYVGGQDMRQPFERVFPSKSTWNILHCYLSRKEREVIHFFFAPSHQQCVALPSDDKFNSQGSSQFILKTKNQETIFSAATGLLARTWEKEDAVVASGDELRCYWWWIFFGFLLEICWISSWKSLDVVASGDGLLLVVPISRNGSRLTLQPTRGHQPLLGAAPKDVTPCKQYLYDDLADHGMTKA